MKEQPEIGAPIIITLSKANSLNEEQEWETISGENIPKDLKDWVSFQYCYSDDEAPKEDDAWQVPKDIDLEKMQATITPPHDNLYAYLHVCAFVTDKWGEGQMSVKLKTAPRVFQMGAWEATDLTYNDGLVEKITCSRELLDRTLCEKTVKLTQEEQKRKQWLIVMLDTEPIDGAGLKIKGGNDNPVLKGLDGINDWSQGANTQLNLYHEEGQKATYEIVEAEYTPKINAYSHRNGMSSLNYDLSPYQDQPDKFFREAAGNGPKVEQALFFIPLALPDKNAKGQKAAIPNADELVGANSMIRKEQVSPAEPGRSLSFRNTSNNPLELVEETVICKVRVRAVDEEGTEDKSIKVFEKKHLLWASVMIEASQETNKEKEPTEGDWGSIKDILDKVNDWSAFESTVLSNNPNNPSQFKIVLHKSEWVGESIAKLELDLKTEVNGVKIFEHPENFYFYTSSGARGIKNNFYIFPIVVARPDENGQYTKLIENPWGEERNMREHLARYAVQDDDIMPEFPEESKEWVWPSEHKDALVTFRFYDYGSQANGNNDRKWFANAVSKTRWYGSPHYEAYEYVGQGLISHNGTDIRARIPADGPDPIRAVASGIICVANYTGYPGHRVVISHGNGLYTMYCHMSKNTENSDDLKITIDGITYNPAYPTGNTALQFPSMLGVQVEAGDVIGHVGSLGTDWLGTMPAHLHFEVRYLASEADTSPSGGASGWSSGNRVYLSPEYYFVKYGVAYGYN